MKKNTFLFVGKKDTPAKRGAHVIAERFASEYSDYLDYFEESAADLNLEEEISCRKKVIFTYQVPQSYNLDLSKYLPT